MSQEATSAHYPDLDITPDDRLWAALAWLPISPLYPLISILALLLDEKKNRPFVRHHAVLSLVMGVVLVLLSFVTFGLAALGFFLFFWWAYEAYQGKKVQIPLIGEWVDAQGWTQVKR